MRKTVAILTAGVVAVSSVAGVSVFAESKAEKSDGVMTYAEYMAADVDSEVVIEGYVQGKQIVTEEGASIYLQDEDGAYFIYKLPCTEKEAELMPVGSKIKVIGYKSEWEGEIEIVDASTFEFEQDDEEEFIAEPLDVTALLGKDELIDHQNQKVVFKGMTVESAGQDDKGNDVAFLYNWNGSGEEGNDLYFNVSLDGNTYSFTVESDLCGPDTDVYKAVKELKIGDKIDMEGFLYWYRGPNPHITAVSAAK